MQTFFLYLGLVGLAVTLPALFVIWLWRVDFRSCSFAPPGGASVVEPWLLRGAADDWARGPASAVFPGGSAVFADGRVQDRVRSPSAAFAPFRTTLGVVPAANCPLRVADIREGGRGIDCAASALMRVRQRRAWLVRGGADVLA